MNEDITQAGDEQERNHVAEVTGLLLIVSGPSGVGKTTITHHVEKQLRAVFSVSITTRVPTVDDVEGRDYLFVTPQQFKMQRDAGHLLESAEVFGHFYGTPRGPVESSLAEGRLVLLEIDVEGAIQVKRNLPRALALFVLPPNEQVLVERLRQRQREDESMIHHRFSMATEEIARARCCGAYDCFIVNDDLKTAVAEAVHWIQQKWTERGASA